MSSTSKYKVYARAVLFAAIVTAVAIGAWFLFLRDPHRNTQTKLVFAEDSRNFWTTPTIIAREYGLFEEEGLDVEVVDFPSGLACKNAVHSGSADIGITGTTPVAVAGFNDEKVVLIASYMRSNQIVKLVARTEGEKLTPDYIVGRKVGIVPGTSSEITFDRLVEKYRLDRSRITRASFRPTELVPALTRGDIDAFVGWEPFPIFAARDIRGLKTFSPPELYTQTLYLVTRPEVVKSKDVALGKFLRAVRQAIERIKDDPEAARKVVEEKVGLRPGELQEVWPSLVFSLECDLAAIIEDLRTEGEWAKKGGLVKGELPSYAAYADCSIYERMTQGKER